LIGNLLTFAWFIRQAQPHGLDETSHIGVNQMKLSVISAVALTAAMLASPAAFAQDTMASPTMIGGQTVSTDDLPKVQAQCDTLNSVEMNSMASSDATNDEPDGAGDLTDPASDVPNGTDQATSTVDLSLITIEECKAAGLVM
jgi:hypothetical protein